MPISSIEINFVENTPEHEIIEILRRILWILWQPNPELHITWDDTIIRKALKILENEQKPQDLKDFIDRFYWWEQWTRNITKIKSIIKEFDLKSVDDLMYKIIDNDFLLTLSKIEGFGERLLALVCENIKKAYHQLWRGIPSIVNESLRLKWEETGYHKFNNFLTTRKKCLYDIY